MNSRQAEDEAGKITALSALAENYGKEFSDALLDMWLNLLSAYPAGQVFAAVKIVIERYEYKTLPPFAVLKAALDDIAGVGEKALELQAIAEWGVLLEQMRKIGYYGTPVLHPTTAYVVRTMGGWHTVCSWEMSGLDFKRRDFIRFWIDSHGRVNIMQLGAGAVQASLAQGRDRNTGPLAIGPAMAALAAGGMRQ